MVATGRYFINVSDYSQSIWEKHRKAQRETIRGPITRVVLMGAGITHSSEVEIIKVGALYIILICVKVSLVSLFMLHFILLTGVNLVTLITLARATFSLKEVHILGFFSGASHFRSIRYSG